MRGWLAVVLHFVCFFPYRLAPPFQTASCESPQTSQRNATDLAIHSWVELEDFQKEEKNAWNARSPALFFSFLRSHVELICRVKGEAFTNSETVSTQRAVDCHFQPKQCWQGTCGELPRATLLEGEYEFPFSKDYASLAHNRALCRVAVSTWQILTLNRRIGCGSPVLLAG